MRIGSTAGVFCLRAWNSYLYFSYLLRDLDKIRYSGTKILLVSFIVSKYVTISGFGNGSIQAHTTCGRRRTCRVRTKRKYSVLDELTALVPGEVSASRLQLLTTPIPFRIFSRVSSWVTELHFYWFGQKRTNSLIRTVYVFNAFLFIFCLGSLSSR